MDLIKTGWDLLDLPDIEWLWPGYIPKGFITLLAGDPGVGKSAIALDLTKRLIEKTEWPDGTPITADSKVLWVDAEGAKVILKERMLEWGIDPAGIILPDQHDLLSDFTINSVSSNQIQGIIESYEPALIIVDSLSGIHQGKENDSQDMKIVLKYIHDWASRNNTAVLVVHHLNKPSQSDSSPTRVTLNRVRGSGQIIASVRSILALEAEPGRIAEQNPGEDITAHLLQIKNNLGEVKRIPIPFSINDKGVTYFDPKLASVYLAPKLSQEEKAQSLINQNLRENGGEIPAKEMEGTLREAGVSESTWKRAKDKMGIESFKKGGRWIWKIAT
jgi:putative DNA primase/helicase